MKTHTSQNY